ncbi:MAG: hypothetical protein Q8J69_00700 [Sphingobacteriaceae bacterium]|nr:hypothetical protein [Sphingobacteriaceae bacterium]
MEEGGTAFFGSTVKMPLVKATRTTATYLKILHPFNDFFFGNWVGIPNAMLTFDIPDGESERHPSKTAR